MIFKKQNDDIEAAIAAATRAAVACSKLSKRLDVIEEHLRALEDALNDGEAAKLKAEKDYIDGMYNILNYNGQKPKGGNLNE